ncbi:MAG: hypothetical protein CPDRYDRY_0409 [uncultured Paraburkholderia sp.]|nr:MAG: hypothetical protein CPDRYDRY_0409 [uncultured Paraburkholderia sp.]
MDTRATQDRKLRDKLFSEAHVMPELSYPQLGTASGKGHNIGLLVFIAVVIAGTMYCAVNLLDDFQLSAKARLSRIFCSALHC